MRAVPLTPHLHGAQVLHYHHGQRYEQHHDFLIDKVNPAPENGGQRIITFLMYLTTVEEGGETYFPLVRPPGIARFQEKSAEKRRKLTRHKRGASTLSYLLWQ